MPPAIVEQSYPTNNQIEGVPVSLSKLQPEISSSGRVVTGILTALERHRMVPGQRLIETELAIQYGVGRNAVREAIAHLAARGIVDLSRHRSPSIRQLLLDEVLEILEVAEAMNGLLASLAARRFDAALHTQSMRILVDQLKACTKGEDSLRLNEVRRQFYRLLLDIAKNRDLRRIFTTIHMELIQAQYPSPELDRIRVSDYRMICSCVIAGNGSAASAAGKRHVRRVRSLILKLAGTSF